MKGVGANAFAADKTVEGLVSTIVPVFNREAMLQVAVGSVLAQTWRPIEVIIVDDGSTDDTPLVAQALQARHAEVQVYRKANGGPGAARQHGVERAAGEFVQFLDSDDTILPHKFALQVSSLRTDTGADIAYSRGFEIVGGVRKPAQENCVSEPQRQLFPRLLNGRFWKTITPLYRREALRRIGPWPNKRQLEDWEFDAQAGSAGIKLHFDDAFLVESHHHESERLCYAWQSDDRALSDMAHAYVAILGHARRAGVASDSPEMRQFTRSLFWMARVAGSRRLNEDARLLLDAAKEVATEKLWELLTFEKAVAALGWRRACLLAERLVVGA